MYQNAWLKSQLCFQPAFLQTFILGQADNGQSIGVPTTPDTYTEFLVLGFNMASLGYCRHLASGPVDRRISLFLSLCLSDMLCYFVIETLFKTLLTNNYSMWVFFVYSRLNQHPERTRKTAISKTHPQHTIRENNGQGNLPLSVTPFQYQSNFLPGRR